MLIRRLRYPKKGCGVYQIKSTTENKIYVGGSSNLRSRKNEHLYRLRKGNHYNILLQKAYNLYGTSDLEFSILCICKKEELLIKEQYFLDLLKPKYNKYFIAGSPLGAKRTKEMCVYASLIRKGKSHKPMSEETKRNISRARTGIKVKPFTTEHKLKIGLKNKGNKNWLGKHHTDNTRKIMSQNAIEIWKLRKEKRYECGKTLSGLFH